MSRIVRAIKDKKPHIQCKICGEKRQPVSYEGCRGGVAADGDYRVVDAEVPCAARSNTSIRSKRQCFDSALYCEKSNTIKRVSCDVMSRRRAAVGRTRTDQAFDGIGVDAAVGNQGLCWGLKKRWETVAGETVDNGTEKAGGGNRVHPEDVLSGRRRT
eukprot:3196973-Rhodomonas_salina.2